MLFCGLRCIDENARSVGGANEHQKSVFLKTRDESKSSKQVKKGGQQSRSVRQKVQGANMPQGHHAGKRNAIQFLRTAITQRVTECHCLMPG